MLVSSADGCMAGDMFHCHVLHNIYTISTHYLHTIYTLTGYEENIVGGGLVVVIGEH